MFDSQKNAESLGRRLLELASAVTCPVDEVRALIAAGAKIDEKDSNGDTALIWAAWYGHTDTALALIAAGAKIDEKDSNGETAEMIARERGHDALVARMAAAHLERATEGFKTGTKEAMPAPPPLRPQPRPRGMAQ